MKLTFTIAVEIDEQTKQVNVDLERFSQNEFGNGTSFVLGPSREGRETSAATYATAEQTLGDLISTADILTRDLGAKLSEIEAVENLTREQKDARQRQASDDVVAANKQIRLKLNDLLAQNDSTVQDLSVAASKARKAAEKSLERVQSIIKRLDDVTKAITKVVEITTAIGVPL